MTEPYSVFRKTTAIPLPRWQPWIKDQFITGVPSGGGDNGEGDKSFHPHLYPPSHRDTSYHNFFHVAIKGEGKRGELSKFSNGVDLAWDFIIIRTY